MTTRVLVVEDEAIIASDLQRMLLDLGYAVGAPAASAEEAVAAAELVRPDVVLMDVHLRGGQDGIDTVERLRAHCDPAVIFLTSYADDRTVARAKAARPNGYLVKPFQERELKTTIEIALNQHLLERRVVDRERLYATTVDALGEGVVVADAEGRITLMNRAAEELSGYSRSEAAGRRVDEIFRADPLTAGRPHETGEPTRGERIFHRDGHVLLVEHDVVPLSSAAAPAQGSLHVLRPQVPSRGERALRARLGRLLESLTESSERYPPIAPVLDGVRQLLGSALAADDRRGDARGLRNSTVR